MRSLALVFMHADAVDVVLMLMGLVGAIGDGMSTPLMLAITSRVYDDAGIGPGHLIQQFTSKINQVRSGSSISYRPPIQYLREDVT